MPAPEDFVPDGMKPGDFVPDASVMDPHPIQSGLKRIGKTIGRYDPSNPANMGRVLPLAAGTGLSAAGAAGGPLTAAATGAAAPLAEYDVARALGESPAKPSWKEVAEGAILNAAFSGGGKATIPEAAGAEGATMQALPPELQNIKNLKQAVKNRDFWQKLGLTDTQIDSAIANPEKSAAALQGSIDRASRIRQTYKDTLDSTRATFKTRYDAAYGAQAEAPVDSKIIATQMRQMAEGQTQHELTPTFQKFLVRKANEIDPPPGQVKTDLGTLAQFEAQKRGITDNKELLRIAKEAREKAAATPSFTVQQARDLRSELRENVPGQATPLDKKAAGQLNELITNQYESSLRAAGANDEQIGRLNGIDQDYARFQETIKTLDPRSERFGQQAADAMFKIGQQHPELALNFVKMARDAGKLPEFRQQFVEDMLGQAKASGAPTDEMKFLRSFQNRWGDSEAGQAVLAQTFGKDSPLSNPTTMSKVLGAVSSPDTQERLEKTLTSRYEARYLFRTALFVGIAGGSAYSIYQHPERAPAIIAAGVGLLVAPKILSRLDAMGQRAYIRMVTNPDSAQAARQFINTVGATTTGVISQPSDQTH